MQKNIQRKNCKFVSVILFLVNLLVGGLIVLGIRHQDEDRLRSQELSEDSNVVPVDQNILDMQNRIATDRENKLRDLNTAPKELKKIDTTTTTTTTTVVEEQQKPDSETKSS